MKLSKLAILATTIAALPIAANAQDAGVTIYSQVDDSTVGTIESNDGTTAVLDTGSYKAPLPIATYAEREGKWTINATKAQIDGLMAQQVAQQEAAAAEAQASAEAAAAEAEAKLAAVLVPGVEVITADAQTLGTVSELAGDNVVVTNEQAGLITLPRSLMATDEAGHVICRANFDAIMAAVQGG
ncbi:MAG: hypothetical protein AAFY51_06915 [Pseudomonadota bacterium]